MARGETGARVHGGQDELTEALVVLRFLNGRHNLPKAGDRPPIVALGLVGLAKKLACQRLQDYLPVGGGERESTLGRGDGLVMQAHDEGEMLGRKGADLAQPSRIFGGTRRGL